MYRFLPEILLASMLQSDRHRRHQWSISRKQNNPVLSGMGKHKSGSRQKEWKVPALSKIASNGNGQMANLNRLQR